MRGEFVLLIRSHGLSARLNIPISIFFLNFFDFKPPIKIQTLRNLNKEVIGQRSQLERRQLLRYTFHSRRFETSIRMFINSNWLCYRLEKIKILGIQHWISIIKLKCPKVSYYIWNTIKYQESCERHHVSLKRTHPPDYQWIF